jgi:hypothetical protein
MENSKRYLLLILLLSILATTKAQDKLTFQEADRVSYVLFENQDWKSLKKFTKQAFSNGFDYYYLRMRAGIACFETKLYFEAADNFEKAIGFNSGDPIAGEYLYYCWIYLNNTTKAESVYQNLPATLQEKLKNTLPKKHNISIETGPVLSNHAQKFEQLDLDGEDDIYGEADIIENGCYFNAGFAWQFKKGYRLFGAYSLLNLNKVQEVKIQDASALSYKYPLTQQQIYINGAIPLGKKFELIAALNFLILQYNVVVPQFDTNNLSYFFPVENFKSNFFIGYLSVNKDFDFVKTNLFVSYSNLNEKIQYQVGLKLILFPLQNLNFYFSSALLNHNNDGQNNFVFEQMIGGKIMKPLWAEINTTFGKMTNYYDNQAFAVYNFAGEMDFKGSVKFIYQINSNVKITFEYLYISRVGNYFVYQETPGNPLQPHPVTMKQDINNQLVLLGINWKF